MIFAYTGTYTQDLHNSVLINLSFLGFGGPVVIQDTYSAEASFLGIGDWRIRNPTTDHAVRFYSENITFECLNCAAYDESTFHIRGECSAHFKNCHFELLDKGIQVRARASLVAEDCTFHNAASAISLAFDARKVTVADCQFKNCGQETDY